MFAQTVIECKERQTLIHSNKKVAEMIYMEFTLEDLYTKKKGKLTTARAQGKIRKDCPIIS